MFEELSAIYSRVVSLTLDVAPDDWMRLWLESECTADSIAIGGYWERKSADEVIFFDIPEDAKDLVWEAWRVSRTHKNGWSTAIFRVDRPDKLHITFGFADLDNESVTSWDRQVAFREATFGDRKIRSTIDMSGAVTLTPAMLESGISNSLLPTD